MLLNWTKSLFLPMNRILLIFSSTIFLSTAAEINSSLLLIAGLMWRMLNLLSKSCSIAINAVVPRTFCVVRVVKKFFSNYLILSDYLSSYSTTWSKLCMFECKFSLSTIEDGSRGCFQVKYSSSGCCLLWEYPLKFLFPWVLPFCPKHKRFQDLKPRPCFENWRVSMHSNYDWKDWSLCYKCHIFPSTSRRKILLRPSFYWELLILWFH